MNDMEDLTERNVMNVKIIDGMTDEEIDDLDRRTMIVAETVITTATIEEMNQEIPITTKEDVVVGTMIIPNEETIMVNITTDPMGVMEIFNLLELDQRIIYLNYVRYKHNRLEHPFIDSFLFTNIKCYKYLDVRTKYNREDETKYATRHPRPNRMQEVALHYELVVRPGGTDTTLSEYNQAAMWSDETLFREIFECDIQHQPKGKVVSWAETAGATPTTIFFKALNTTTYVAPKTLDRRDIVTGIKFTDITTAIVFHVQNADRSLLSLIKHH